MKTNLRTDITVRQICDGFVYNELEGRRRVCDGDVQERAAYSKALLSYFCGRVFCGDTPCNGKWKGGY